MVKDPSQLYQRHPHLSTLENDQVGNEGFPRVFRFDSKRLVEQLEHFFTEDSGKGQTMNLELEFNSGHLSVVTLEPLGRKNEYSGRRRE